jgi:uncharacterized protein YqeY
VEVDLGFVDRNHLPGSLDFPQRVPMNLKEKLTESLKQAMRDKDEPRKRTVRLALAAIKNAEIDSKSALDEAAILAILQKEAKSRREMIEGAELAGREDLIAEALGEIDILDEFLPKPLSEDELMELAKCAVEEAGASSLKEMGNVMKIIIPKVAGRADGKQVSIIVRGLLSQ